MDEYSSKNVELMKKLKALAETGVGGEKENASRMLDKLMKKYGVEFEELDDEKLEEHSFKYSDKFEKKLIVQVCYKVATGRELFKYKYGKGSQSTLICVCTKAEAIQIQIEYDFYKELWKDEVNFLLEAFVQKHKIFDTKPGHKTSEIDNDALMKMRKMQSALDDRFINPMLEESDERRYNP